MRSSKRRGDGRKSRHVPTLKSNPCTDSSNFCSNPAREFARTGTLAYHTSLERREEEEENARLDGKGEAQVREEAARPTLRNNGPPIRAKRPAAEAVYSRLLARSLASSVCFPALHRSTSSADPLRARVPVLSHSLSRSRVVVSRGDRPLGDRLGP